MDKIKTIIIAGPTASGKTSLGVSVAQKFNGEVVSADSMQIYKHMSIATAMPTEAEMQGIPHHMIDFVEPTDSYSVAKYKEDAMRCIREIASRGKVPVIVGGTGLYIDTLIHNTEFYDIEIDESLRNKLCAEYDETGAEKMWKRLESIDPDCAKNIHLNNKKKIIRALEIYYQTGKTLSQQNAESHLSGEILDYVMIGLNAHDREYLYNRINKRVDMMLENGLVREAEEFFNLYAGGTAVQAIGYKELRPYFDNEIILDECIENLKMQTRRYAKRQLTWFRRYTDIRWIYIDEFKGNAVSDEAVKILKERMKK